MFNCLWELSRLFKFFKPDLCEYDTQLIMTMFSIFTSIFKELHYLYNLYKNVQSFYCSFHVRISFPRYEHMCNCAKKEVSCTSTCKAMSAI